MSNCSQDSWRMNKMLRLIVGLSLPLFNRKRVYQKIEISSLDAFKNSHKSSHDDWICQVWARKKIISLKVYFFNQSRWHKGYSRRVKKTAVYICFHMVFDRLPYDYEKLKFSFSRCNVWWQQRAPSISRMIVAKGDIFYHCKTGHETWKIHAPTGFERVPARLRLALFTSWFPYRFQFFLAHNLL